ncbi:phage portal protein [Candidatus Avoscillospira sp. LCP25S3_F1]|uniref:phage portal protein n=1 Tax=Candidatus Avoscillospira sp. LCP25S3_F1 TaxID=3438825 RepID=UPI003F8F38B8
MSVSNGLRAVARSPSGGQRVQNAITVDTLTAAGALPVGEAGNETFARKLSAVDRCIEILSDSMAKLPTYCVDRASRERVDLPLLTVLNVRPNEAMTPFIRKKLLETSRLVTGNGYDWIIRDPYTAQVRELIPLPGHLVTPWRDTNGRVWYHVCHPYSGSVFTLSSADICHYKGATRDGLKGISVLRRASEVIASARARQQHDLSYYQHGGQPSGVLKTDADLSGYAKDANGDILRRADGTAVTLKDQLRSEWERVHSGPTNAFKLAVLDYGLDYKPLAISNRDAQFIESQEVAIRDIARYFGIPLYKLQEGKQSYSSNEQNAIEYVVSTLHPIVTQYEEETTWKLLFAGQVAAGLELRINMMAELRGDNAARGAWYKTMWEIGGFSVNNIMQLEDMPDVEGGDERMASLNYVPLSIWKELSLQRNTNRNGGETT